MPRSHAHDHLAKVEVDALGALRAWFEAHHDQPESIWLVTYKKSVPDKYVANTDVVDLCVAFGWMDGRRMKRDEARTMQLLSPRKAAHWSKSYKDRYARLVREGRMHPAGERCVEAAKASGAWDFMNDVDALIVPDDLQRALDAEPTARANYAAFPDSAKRDILRWIKLAKREATRQKRIAETVRKAAIDARASGTGKRG
ncbi:MAG: YdeI/OmpD-associated family protein [Acidobacteriota bacterium]